MVVRFFNFNVECVLLIDIASLILMPDKSEQKDRQWHITVPPCSQRVDGWFDRERIPLLSNYVDVVGRRCLPIIWMLEMLEMCTEGNVHISPDYDARAARPRMNNCQFIPRWNSASAVCSHRHGRSCSLATKNLRCSKITWKWKLWFIFKSPSIQMIMC